MLGKLLKHDFIATWKVMVAIDAVLVILGIATSVLIQAVPHVEESVGMSLFMFSFIGLFYVGLIAANVVTIIYLTIRYYRNLYTSEGYLTFTLPVKTDLVIHSKVITGTVWMFLTYFCTAIALLLAGGGFLRTVQVSGEDVREAINEVVSFMGFSDPGFIAVITLAVLVTPIATVLSIYFCVSVGQLWQNHKILGAVLCFIGLYFVNQIFSQFAFFGSGFWRLMMSSGEDIDMSFGHVYRNMMLIITIITMIQSVIYYISCIMISRKKLNLD